MTMDIKPLAVITGGSGYVGTSIVTALAQAGWDTISLSRENGCDITDTAQVEASIAALKGRPINACIHAAALPPSTKRLSEVAPGEFEEEIGVAVHGAFNLAQATLDSLAEGAAFIGITTKLIEPGIITGPLGGYIPSKYALRGFLRALAQEEKKTRVYAIAPGYMPGGFNALVPPAILSMLAHKSGAGQTDAQMVAELVVELCTNSGAYAPGSSISIPGIDISPL